MSLFNTNKKFILGSSSPRRKEMLTQLGVEFTVCKPDILEERRANESPVDYVKRNCEEKAQWVREKVCPTYPVFIISADTIVVQGESVLEKPSSVQDAARMLAALSGSTHEVISCFCVLKIDGDSVVSKIHHESTRVKFADLSEQDIQYYVGTGEPMDKAGAYGIQGIGGFLIESINGSYSNVVGLPTRQLVDCIRALD